MKLVWLKLNLANIKLNLRNGVSTSIISLQGYFDLYARQAPAPLLLKFGHPLKIDISVIP